MPAGPAARYCNPHGSVRCGGDTGAQPGGGFVRWFFADSLPVNIDQYADAEHAEEEVRAAVADEGKRDAFVGQQGGGHADVHGGLDGEHRHDPEAEQHPEPVARLHRDQGAANDDHDVAKYNQQSKTQPEFLAESRENEIGVRLRKVGKTLASVAQSQAPTPPSPKAMSACNCW